jgi:hypothetical protein
MMNKAAAIALRFCERGSAHASHFVELKGELKCLAQRWEGEPGLMKNRSRGGVALRERVVAFAPQAL